MDSQLNKTTWIHLSKLLSFLINCCTIYKEYAEIEPEIYIDAWYVIIHSLY